MVVTKREKRKKGKKKKNTVVCLPSLSNDARAIDPLPRQTECMYASLELSMSTIPMTVVFYKLQQNQSNDGRLPELHIYIHNTKVYLLTTTDYRMSSSFYYNNINNSEKVPQKSGQNVSSFSKSICEI